MLDDDDGCSRDKRALPVSKKDGFDGLMRARGFWRKKRSVAPATQDMCCGRGCGGGEGKGRGGGEGERWSMCEMENGC
jgi:hypothetical protein